MPDALIGHTGFVGGNLIRQRHFDAVFHSQTIDEIAGRSFELLVCSGAPAEKWRANQDPEGDWARLKSLFRGLEQTHAKQVVLISTVDVFPTPIGVDEDTPLSPADLSPYGRHRLLLENFVRERFDTLVVRLPGLFGPGLKKNVIYDFIHNNRLDLIHSEASFQFYGLAHLWRDITTALSAELKTIHFAVEPATVREVAAVVFEREFNQKTSAPPARYDFRTRHAALFNGQSGYLYSKAQVLEDIKRFVMSTRSRGLVS